MTKENAKEWLPLVQAMAEGKTIEMFTDERQWKEANFIKTSNCYPSRYRVKPEPREWCVIWPQIQDAKKAASVSPGQRWAYKCTLPFHENDAPITKTVIAVTNDSVQFEWMGIISDDSLRGFVVDSTLITNSP